MADETGQAPLRSRWIPAALVMLSAGFLTQSTNAMAFLVAPSGFTFGFMLLGSPVVILGIVFAVRAARDTREMAELAREVPQIVAAMPETEVQYCARADHKAFTQRFKDRALILMIVFTALSIWLHRQGTPEFWVLTLAVFILVVLLYLAVYFGWFRVRPGQMERVYLFDNALLVRRIRIAPSMIESAAREHHAGPWIRYVVTLKEKSGLPLEKVHISLPETADLPAWFRLEA